MIQTNLGNRTFEHRPVVELFAIVKNDLRKLDDEGLVDEGTLIKTVMYCNDKLGISIREIKQACIPVENYKAKLPIDFEKLYYAGAVTATNTSIVGMRNPFDNKFDRDVIYEAEIAREDFGGTDHYNVTIKREQNVTVHNCQSFIGLDVHPTSINQCHSSSPNTRKTGRYTIRLENDHIITPFRTGEIYIIYIGTMCDEYGNLLFPFHPSITPYYEWALKEKVLTDAFYNSDGDLSELKVKLEHSRMERVKAWLDAFNMTTEKGYGEYVDQQRKKELGWYSQYFKYLQ